MKRKLSKQAKACIAREIGKHCGKKRGKGCKIPSVQRQAIAIGFSICRRKGFRSIPAKQ